MNAPVIVQKSLSASSSSRVESSWRWVGSSNSSNFPWRMSCSSPRSGRSRVEVDVLRRCSPQRFLLFHRLQGIWRFHFFAALTLPLHWAFRRGVQMHPSPPILQCPRPECLLPRFTPRKTHNQEMYLARIVAPNWCSLAWSFAEIGWYSTIAPNGITGPLNGIPNRLSYGVFPSDKRSRMFRR